jgi:hypothetical protein
MFMGREDHQILLSVVLLVAVPMMNMLVGSKLPPEKGLDH